MAINFTDSPANGATQVIGGRTYTYNSAKNKWDTTATEVTAPTATVYANVDALPTSGNITGAQAYVSGNNRLYIWNGTGWYNIALINTAPSIGGANSSYTLATDGTPTTVTLTASDPEGLPVAYSIASDTSGDIATVTQGTGVNVNVFTITPTTNTANAGTFSLTFRASDGVNLATAVSEFTLQFFISNSNYTTSLITTNGSTGQNTTFTDSSSNSHTVTANGNVNQSSFSPYRSGGYSAYFDGSGDYLSIVDNSMTSTGEFTVEGWAYITSNTTQVIFHWSDISDNLDNDLVFEVNGKVTCRVGSGGNTKTSTADGVWSVNTWHHFAVVRNSSNNVDVYLDGTHIIDHGVRTDDMDNTLEIGRNPYSGGGSYVTGYITDFRIVESALYNSSFTPPTERLSNVTNTKLLTCHLPYFADGSTNGYTITPNGNVSTKPFGPYDYQEYAVGNHGGSAYFDGSGDYLSVPSSSALEPGSGNFTIEGWVYPLAYPGSGTGAAIAARDNSSGYANFSVNIRSNGAIEAYFSLSNTSSAPQIINAGTAPIGAWTHIAFVKNGLSHTLYVNGTSVATVTAGSNPPTGLSTITKIGQADGTLNGYLSDVRIVNSIIYTGNFTPPTAPLSAITNTNLLLNMQNAVILDKSQTVTNIILSGATASTAQYKYLPSSIYFDGTNDYVRADDAIEGITSTTPFTIEAWVYPTQIGVTGDRDYFFGINTLSAGGNVLLIGVSNIGVNGSSDDITDLSLNTWSHIAFVYDGSGGWKYYINGALDYTHSDTITLDGSSFVIGAEADAANAGSLGNYFGGYLSDIRVTKGLQRYTANFTPPATALQG